jgi:hypothetical protein
VLIPSLSKYLWNFLKLCTSDLCQAPGVSHLDSNQLSYLYYIKGKLETFFLPLMDIDDSIEVDNIEIRIAHIFQAR